MNDVYLRPLEEKDAKISYKWRNDSKVWELTGSRPDRIITYEIEFQWIKQVLLREDEIRFAICLNKTSQYIGNVQLTSITNSSAEFHIFIGEKQFWGKGIGTKATKLMLRYAFENICLKEVYLLVNKDNIPAIKAYEKNGFVIKNELIENRAEKYKMVNKGVIS